MPCQRYFFIFQCIVPKAPTRRFDHFTLKTLYPSTFPSHRVGIIASPYLPSSWPTASIKQTFLGYHTPLPELVAPWRPIRAVCKFMPCQREFCVFQCIVPKGPTRRFDHVTLKMLDPSAFASHRVGIIASPYLPDSWTTASIKQTFLGYHTPLRELVSAQFRLHSQVKCEMLRHT